MLGSWADNTPTDRAAHRIMTSLGSSHRLTQRELNFIMCA